MIKSEEVGKLTLFDIGRKEDSLIKYGIEQNRENGKSVRRRKIYGIAYPHLRFHWRRAEKYGF